MSVEAQTQRFALLSYKDVPNVSRIDMFEQAGGFQGLRKAFDLGHESVFDEINAAGILERGPLGGELSAIWQSFPLIRSRKKYLVASALSFSFGVEKDIYLAREFPHLVIEGIVIACYALGIDKVYVVLPQDDSTCLETFDRALKEAFERRIVGTKILGHDFHLDFEVLPLKKNSVAALPSSLINFIETKKAQPNERKLSLFERPVLVHSLETLALFPWIVSFGAGTWKKWGTSLSAGTFLLSLFGDVKKPGIYEVPYGIPIKTVIEEFGGGTQSGMPVQMVFPGGLFRPPLKPESAASARLSPEDLKLRGSGLQEGQLLVVGANQGLSEFFRNSLESFLNESCAKCAPCIQGIDHLISKHQNKGPNESARAVAEVLLQGGMACSLPQHAGEFYLSFEKLLRSGGFHV